MLKLNIVIVTLLISIGTVYAGEEPDRCPSSDGEIWVQHADGSSEDQFNPGVDVYLGGKNFDPYEEYSYEVLDNDNDRRVVADGMATTDGTGNIIATHIGTIPPGDYVNHTYIVKLDVFSDECWWCRLVCGPPKLTRVIVTDSGNPSTIPEYPTVMIPAIMALGGYMVIRLKRRKGE